MDISVFNNDNIRNCTLSSEVPGSSKTEGCILGIDEAGRGPVLGPMVYGCCYCPKSQEEKLKKLGFADSKTLTEEKRENLFNVISENSDFIGWNLQIISPNYISNCMLQRSKYSLNEVSHDSAIYLIKLTLESGVNLEEVYVDTVGVAAKYQAKLSQLFPDLKITVAKQADATYPIVSAASICAKVARDRAIKSWKFQEGNDFADKDYGSGYPNDPLTKTYLSDSVQKVFGFPQIVRFSWSTAEKILLEKAVPVQWDIPDEALEESPQPVQKTNLFQFFKRTPTSPTKSNPPKHHNFFKSRGLSQTSEL